MEARKITIVQTKNQKKSVIMSAATTLAELKADLRQNDIDYSGMTFFEGTSKVELKNDASVLPHDVPYKGTVTNELVFMLTNTDKKIRSGAKDGIKKRRAIYDKIIELGLQDECKRKFGRNFTQCTTANLISLVDSKIASFASTMESTPKDKEENGEIEVHEIVDTKARKAISRLAKMLCDAGYIGAYEIDKIMDIIKGKVEDAPAENNSLTSSYSDNEIDNMFEEMDL